MRNTIRDRYYIITGHTYEEYCKKYRRGIGKGKLISFTEDEAKYLKKNKHYWEVIGPDGKTLYCQVNKLKPKHIIIPAVIAALIGGGTAAGVIYLPKLLHKKDTFTGEVTEAEWKSSFEDICNINESRTLNYKTTSTISTYYDRTEKTQTYKNLLVDGDKEEATLVTENNEESQIYMARLKQVPVTYINGVIQFNVSTIVNDIAQLLTGLNEQMSYFTFDKENKNYTYSYKATEATKAGEFEYIETELSFNSDKKVKSLKSSYKITGKSEEKPAVKFDSKIEYEYGTCSLTWGEQYEEPAKAYTIPFNKSSEEESLITDNFKEKLNLKSFVVYTDSPLNDLNAIVCKNGDSVIKAWFGSSSIFKNNIELTSGVDYLVGTGEDYGVLFTTPVKSTDKISIRIDANDTLAKVAAPQLKFIKYNK